MNSQFLLNLYMLLAMSTTADAQRVVPIILRPEIHYTDSTFIVREYPEPLIKTVASCHCSSLQGQNRLTIQVDFEERDRDSMLSEDKLDQIYVSLDGRNDSIGIPIFRNSIGITSDTVGVLIDNKPYGLKLHYKDTIGCRLFPYPTIRPDIWIGSQFPKNTALQGIAGGSYSFDSMFAASKAKFIYINFWATWCAPCIENIRHYNRIAKSSNILLVNVCAQGCEADAIQKAIQKYNFLGAHCLSNPIFAKMCNQNGFPYGLVVDSSYQIVGYDFAENFAALEELLH
jgi:thiol-disulfide isomerase/thioredoxin